MKIFYKYKGFVRSSELNLDPSSFQNHVLLGEYGEDMLDLFGVLSVERDSQSNYMYYSLDGFTKDGSGQSSNSMGGLSFQILSKLFENTGWGQNISSEEEAMELLGLVQERLDVEVVQNPTGEYPENDLYTYLHPEDRVIKSCSSLKVQVPPNFICIPTSLPISIFTQGFEYLTFKRENNPIDTITPLPPNVTEQQILEYQIKVFETLILSQDRTSLAFAMGEVLNITDARLDELGNPIGIYTGLDISGIITYAGESYNLLANGFVDIMASLRGDTPEILIPDRMESEVNSLTIYPTPGVPQELDGYYMLGGNSSGVPVTMYSCAKAVINYDTTPVVVNPYVVINNSVDEMNGTNSNFRLELSVEPYVDTSLYNAEKIDNLTNIDMLFNDKLSIYLSSDGSINFSSNLESGILKVILKPGDQQKFYSNRYLEGFGDISTEGTFVFYLAPNSVSEVGVLA